MENNVCGVNRLDSDVLLPPRKRLLACLKKQNSDVDSNPNSKSPSISNSLDQLDTRISNMLKAHLSSDNPSQEEIVTASRAAAEVAVKVAMAARATAQEKAIMAAKAMAAAKKALELVANVEDGHQISPFAEQEQQKNKRKQQCDLQMLHHNVKPCFVNGKANDEELARKLHQAINSSPRISNGSNTKPVKRLKTTENDKTILVKEVVNMRKSNGSNTKPVEDDNNITTSGRKRGRMKQKKLPLSICHDRDQSTPKAADVTSRGLLSVGPSGPLWKCQAFKAPACVKQNKVMQS